MRTANDFRLHCCVDAGLDNFEVGLSDVFPDEGSPVSADSYTLCGRYSGSVTAGMEIIVNCAPLSRPYRYVIVRRSSATTERLCIAEVAVLASMKSRLSVDHIYSPCAASLAGIPPGGL